MLQIAAPVLPSVARNMVHCHMDPILQLWGGITGSFLVGATFVPQTGHRAGRATTGYVGVASLCVKGSFAMLPRSTTGQRPLRTFPEQATSQTDAPTRPGAAGGIRARNCEALQRITTANSLVITPFLPVIFHATAARVDIELQRGQCCTLR